MKRIISFVFCACTFISLFAQSVPEWVDVDVRELLFPSDKYITGYAEQYVSNKQEIAHATEVAKSNAQMTLMEGIYLKIKGNTSSSVESVSYNGEFYENESFKSSSSKSVLAEVNGMQIKTFYNPKTKYAHAFAYVSRADLSSFYNNSLFTNLLQVNNLINNAKSLKAQDKLVAAREQCSEAKSVLSEIENIQNLLISLNDATYINNVSLKSNVESLKKDLVILDESLDVKYEKLDNTENKIKVNITKLEGVIELSNQLIGQNEKNSAKSKCEEALPLIKEVRELQALLLQIEPNISSERLHNNELEQLEKELLSMISNLSQSNRVYIETSASDKNTNALKNKIKSELTNLNCSFTDDESNADYKIILDCSLREGSNVNNLVFAYADVNVTLLDVNKEKEIYSDFISVKGGSGTIEKAEYKAIQNTASQIIQNISNYIK